MNNQSADHVPERDAVTIEASAATGEDPPRSWLRQAAHRVRSAFRGKQNSEALREAVEELIEEPTSESGMPPAERLLLSNILTIRERTAADCMVPRADIVAVDIHADLKALVDTMAEHVHSRIPVYRDTLDDVLGMVHMKDVMSCLAHEKQATVSSLLRPVLFVAPSTPALKLLLQMRHTRQHMALVVDEFGGIDGLITIEDLVEEIVGEIEDEHDEVEQPRVIMRADGTMIADARLPIEEFEARVGPIVDDEEREEIDTLGGYLFILAGRIPPMGEVIRHANGMEFEVIDLDHNRIKRVRVRNIPRNLQPDTPRATGTGG